MCGLIGFLGSDAQGGPGGSVAAAVEASLVDMRHRGPDEGGTWSDDDVVIGFRRLSIIDIDSSHQPLPYLDGRYQLIFNGEIYNYLELRERLARDFGATFETDGDSEAIVAGYHHLGEKIVRELRGMFVFLIWDRAGAGAVRRPGLVRHQTAVHLQPTPAARSSPARRSRCSTSPAPTRPGPARARWTRPRCSTT